MTSLSDIHRLVLAGRVNATAARAALPGEDVEGRREAAQHSYLDADAKLQGEPLESVHPVYGPGILVGVNRDGWGLFHPDASDHPLEVDVFELREVP